MCQSEEEARLEGIHLLEAHVKLLREARAELRSNSIARSECTTSDLKVENRLLKEIEKVALKIETWRRSYEEEYLGGHNIWDLIQKEEDENKEDLVKREAQKMRDDYFKGLRLGRECGIENFTVMQGKGEDDGNEERVIDKAEEEERIAFLCKGSDTYPCTSPGEEIDKETEEEMDQELSDMNYDVLREEAKKCTVPDTEERTESKKRPLEDTCEEEEEEEVDEEDCAKRRKIYTPDEPTCKQSQGHRVLVQNLPLTIQYNDLKNYFLQFGPVSKVFLKNGSGCGYVIYESESVASLVCDLKHEFNGQEANVVKDTPRAPRNTCPQPTNQDNQVFLYKIPQDTDPKTINSVLSVFGPVLKVTKPNNRNFAFVAFEEESSKVAALHARKVTIGGRTVMIRPSKTFSEEGKLIRKDAGTKERRNRTPDRPRIGHQVFVFGVNVPMDLNGFQVALAKFGTVVSVFMPEDKNYAFVGFDKEHSQRAALKAGCVTLPCGRGVIKPVTKKREEGSNSSPDVA